MHLELIHNVVCSNCFFAVFDARLSSNLLCYLCKRCSVFCQNISECALLSSALSPKISAITGDSWWSFEAPRGGNGEGRNHSGWLWGIQEIHVHVLVNYGLLSKISGCGSRGEGRFVYLGWVRHWLIQPRLEDCHKFWSFSQTGMHMGWQCDLSTGLASERKVSVLSEWRQVVMLFKLFMGLWWFFRHTWGKHGKKRCCRGHEWDSTCNPQLRSLDTEGTPGTELLQCHPCMHSSFLSPKPGWKRQRGE